MTGGTALRKGISKQSNTPFDRTGKLIAPATIKGVSIDATTDDGVPAFIDGKKVIDDWRDRSPETDSYFMDLDSGKVYAIEIDYYQDGGGASARLSWTAGLTGIDNRFLNQIALSCRTPEMAGEMSFKSQIADAIEYYFIYGPEPDQIVSGIRTITGKAPLYPKWAYRPVHESVQAGRRRKRSKA